MYVCVYSIYMHIYLLCLCAYIYFTYLCVCVCVCVCGCVCVCVCVCINISWRRKWQPTPVFLPRVPGTEEPGGLQSMVSQRVRHDLVTEHGYI